MELYDLKITIKGTSPMLMHRFTEEAQLKATTGDNKSGSRASADTPREIAEQFFIHR